LTQYREVAKLIMHSFHLLRNMIKNCYKNIILIIGICYCSVLSCANYPWRVSLGFGYGHFQDMFYQDGYYPSLKIALGKGLISTNHINLGLELGMETGNTMRLDVPKPLLNQVGGMPMQSTVKPIFDILETLQAEINRRFFGVLKAGGALRSWQFERCSSVDKMQVNPEFQVGMGYHINQKSYVELVYRSIVGRPLTYVVNTGNEQLYVSGSPTQQGILLNITLLLDNETI
jgi:hypothetical protein